MVYVDGDRCTGCGACLEICPQGAIELVGGLANIDGGRCTGCEACVQACPEGAILVVTEPAGERAVVPGVSPLSSIVPGRLASPPLSLGNRAVPLVVSTLTFLGREVAPRLIPRMLDVQIAAALS